MKVLVCGSRDVGNREMVFEILDRWAVNLGLGADTVLITGGAKGVDKFAYEWGTARGFQSVVVNADWDRDGKGAGFKRNRKMLTLAPAHVLGIMKQGGSKGTLDMLTISKRSELNVKVVYVNGLGGK